MLPLARVGGSPVAHPPIKQSFNDLYTQLLAHPAPCDVVAQPPRRAFAPPLSPCEELPDELLLRVLERVMRGWDW